MAEWDTGQPEGGAKRARGRRVAGWGWAAPWEQWKACGNSGESSLLSPLI